MSAASIRRWSGLVAFTFAMLSASAADALWDRATQVAATSQWKPDRIRLQALASDGTSETGREEFYYEVRPRDPAYAVIIRHVVNGEETSTNVGERVLLTSLYRAVQPLFDPDLQPSITVERKDEVVIDGVEAVNFEFKMPGARGTATLTKATAYPISAAWDATRLADGTKSSTTRVLFVLDADGKWHARTLVTTTILDLPARTGVPRKFTTTLQYE